MVLAKKTLGQHWLHDEATLNYIARTAELKPGETVLEIGPGTGTLTAKLLARGAQVVAVEKDGTLAKNLPHHISIISEAKPRKAPRKAQSRKARKGGLEVVVGDILRFDLTRLPKDYKVVANIPYYLTSNLLRVLSESANPPKMMVLLLQKEVAKRIAAEPRQMSLLSVSVQLFYEPRLGKVVPAALFEPPPKVDSRVIVLKHREKPLFENLDSKKFFRIVKAGFSERRKKLRSSLSGGLAISKEQADDLLKRSGVDSGARAQELSLEQWHRLSERFSSPAPF